MSVARAVASGLNRKRQRVGVLGPAVGFPIGLGTHARRARHNMGVTLQDNGNIAFLELDRLECDVADQRYPARAASDDVILEHVLSARHNVGCNPCCWWSFSDPRRFGG